MEMNSVCVAAIATPLACGGLGVVKISGYGAIEKINKIFKPIKHESLNSLKGYEASYGKIVDLNGKEIDDAVALVFRAPKSYTGEDVVELSCHGGTVVLKIVLNLCFKVGCEPATNGEFTKRAFLNGKISLTQAEAVADLINAESKLALKAAVEMKNGFLFKQTQLICNELIEISSQIEAYLNYPDEDVELPNLNTIEFQIEKIILKLTSLVENFKFSQNIKNGIKVAIIGEPNVGKSTLMNLLVGVEKSIVTEISGTTRDVISEHVELNGINFSLFDTAGIRPTSDKIEKIGIEKTKQILNEASLILFVVDGSKCFFCNLLNEINKLDVLKICVLNKTDLGHFNFNKKQFNFDAYVSTTNKNLSSILKLKKTIVSLVQKKLVNFNCSILMNNRQNNLINKAINELSEIKNLIQNKAGLDVIGALLEVVLDYFFQLNGKVASKEIVDEIFSKFCVGK